MVNYKVLGYNTFEEYKLDFVHTLLPTNKTYEYFVDWEKVHTHLKKYKYEISLLDSLLRVSSTQRVTEFKTLIRKYPKVVELIPILVAERVKNAKINLFDPEYMRFFEIRFSESDAIKELDKIVRFVDKTGLFSLMNEIKSFYDYLLGVEVGLDTNARKNRSGKIFENMVQDKVENILSGKYRIVRNDKNFSLYPKIKKDKKSKSKKHDIVIWGKDAKIPVGIIECNFYNVTGSKPVSISESYVEMYSVALKLGITFVWVTDGGAWKNMEDSLYRAMEEIEWVLNFRMIEKVKVIF